MGYMEAVASATDNSHIEASLYIFPEAQPPCDFELDFIQGMEVFQPIPSNDRRMGAKWGTLEEGRVRLDGSYEFPSVAEPRRMGQWSKMLSLSDGTFNEPVTGTLLFVSPEKVENLSIIFDDAGGEYATKLRISYGDTTEEFTNDATTFSCRLGAEAVSEITIDLLEWNKPNRMAKVCEVLIGETYTFTEDEIFSFNIEESIAPFESAMPIPYATLVVDNCDDKWSILNPSGIAKHLREAMQLNISIGIDEELVNCSEWYLTEWTNDPSNLSATFVTRPKIYFGGTYSSDSIAKKTVAEVCDAVINGFIDYEISEELAGIVINVGLNSDLDLASAMQQIGNAVGGVWLIGRDNVYRLVKYQHQSAYRTIDNDVIFTEPKIEQFTAVNSIRVQYAIVGRNKDGETIFTPREYVKQINANLGEVKDLISSFITSDGLAESSTEAMHREYIKYRLGFEFEMKGDPKIAPYKALYTILDQGETSLQVLKTQTTYSEDILTTRVYGRGLLTESSLDVLYSGMAYAGGYIG